MVKLKTNVGSFLDLLKMVELEGKSPEGSTEVMINGCVLECKEGKVRITALAVIKAVLLDITYTGAVIEEEGNLPIGNLSEFLEYLQRFKNSDEVTIELEKAKSNKILISRVFPKKIAHISSYDEETIDEYNNGKQALEKFTADEKTATFGSITYKSSVILGAENVKEMLDDGNVRNLTRDYPFEITPDGINCTVGDDTRGKIENFTLAKGNATDTVKSAFRSGIDNVFRNLSGDLVIFMENNAPMVVVKVADNYIAKFVIAPRI